MAASRGPLSLQTYCFMKLINDFEAFPFESLAFLPMKIRYKLIQNLPAVDVCQLEQSSFVEGLDMEEVWDSIARRSWISRTKSRPSKDYFYSEVCKIILSTEDPKDDIIRVLKLLFCNKWGYDWYGRRNPPQLPPRYRQYSALSLSDLADCITLVLEKTRYHPQALEIDASEFYKRLLSDKSSPWLEGGEYHHLLVEYLSEVCYLTIHLPSTGQVLWKDKRLREFCRYSDDIITKEIVPFVMKVCSNKGQLEELTISDHRGDSFESVVYAISPYLKRSEATIDHNKLKSLSRRLVGRSYLKRSEATIDHNNLKSLSLRFLVSYLRRSQISAYNDAAVLELVEIIESQTSLCRLELDLHSPNNHVSCREVSLGLNGSRLCTALAGLMRQPQFCEMKLDMSIPSRGFQEIMHSFITTPRSEDCSLSLGGSLDDDSSLARYHSCLSPPRENILYKTLTLTFRFGLSLSVIRWLREHVGLHLKELCLILPSVASRVASLLKHPRMEVNQLTLKCDQYDEYSTPLSDEFDHILQNGHLQHLTIELCTIDMPSLIRGLHKQAELGSLETLTFIDGYMYRDHTAVTPLFDAIVSLPQLENFTLDVGFHCDDHNMVLYDKWKEKADGKRFKRLVYRSVRLRSVPPQDLLLLQNIAQDFVFVELKKYLPVLNVYL